MNVYLNDVERENVKPIIAMGPSDSAQPSASPAQCRYSYLDSGTRRRAGTRANGLVARAHRENGYHILLPST